ncbi:MAG: helix-turn-helix transcriptional regulator [Lachnospiraceae bacterium]|nr:helix-turn-helix transcriptional regulator [Lachnospiraceae bacterium]
MFIKRIRDLREDNDLTQTELGKILHISQRTYSHYENGTRDIPIEILIKLAHYYNTSVDYILGETNTRKPYK